MSNNKFNYEKEIKKLEKQLIKLSKNTREKFYIELHNELSLLISRKTKEIKNKIRLNKIDQNKKNLIQGISKASFKLKPQKGLNIPNSYYDNILQEKLYLNFFSAHLASAQPH